MYFKDLEESIHSALKFSSLYKKTFLITGATGLIASYLIDLLFYANNNMDAGIVVYAVVRNQSYAEKRFQSILSHPFFHLVIQDVCDPVVLQERVDYIIHTAGDGYPNAFREHPVETMLPAVVGTFQLLEYMKKTKGTRFLYLSSGEIYGCVEPPEIIDTGKYVLNAKGITETISGYVDTMKSRSCYPSAKRAAETLCASYYAEYGLDTVVARLSHVYGPYFSEKDNRASAQFFRDIISGRKVLLKSRGNQLRSYTYVADCVSALLTILTCGTPGDAYNVSTPGATATIAEFAETVAEIGGGECFFEDSKANSSERSPVTYAILNSEKLQTLGWTGYYSIARGVRHTLEALRIQPETCYSAK